MAVYRWQPGPAETGNVGEEREGKETRTSNKLLPNLHTRQISRRDVEEGFLLLHEHDGVGPPLLRREKTKGDGSFVEVGRCCVPGRQAEERRMTSRISQNDEISAARAG